MSSYPYCDNTCSKGPCLFYSWVKGHYYCSQQEVVKTLWTYGYQGKNGTDLPVEEFLEKYLKYGCSYRKTQADVDAAAPPTQETPAPELTANYDEDENGEDDDTPGGESKKRKKFWQK